MLDFGYYNIDCMEGMREFPDNYFELAIVDPPYGDGGGTWKRTDASRFGGVFDRYREQAFTANSTPSPTGGIPNSGGGGYRRNRHITNGLRKGQRPPSCELVELGRRSSEKNHSVGRRAGKRIFRRAFPRLTESDYMGGELLRITRKPLFSDMA